MADISQWENDCAIAMQNAINNVTEKILGILKDCIDARGIGDGELSTHNKEFREAWEQELAKRIGLSIEGNIHYEPSMLSLDADNFIHGSNYYDKGNDERPYLDDIIFEGLAGDLFGEGYWRSPRDAWQDMLNIVEPNIDKWLDEEMVKQGFNGKTFIHYHN